MNEDFWETLKRDKKVRVTRTVKKRDPDNYGHRTFKKGEILYKYTGYTYGCIGDGVALSEAGSRETPFFEFPADAIEEITE